MSHESNALYFAAITEIQEKGTVIQSITGDGRKGFAQLLPGVPVQMCHFHQVQIINRCLIRNPKSVAACELRALVLNLKNSTETTFKEALAAWHTQHKNYLNERSTSPRHRTLALHTQALEKRLQQPETQSAGISLPLSVTLTWASSIPSICWKGGLPI